MAATPHAALAAWDEAVAASGAVFVPIRHHSPACARHVAARIRALRPSAVLVEGPDDMTPLIPLLLHAETRAPVAVYAAAAGAGSDGLRSDDAAWSPDGSPPRAVAFYPLCDYSPELVALREGARAGASLAFVDLTWPEQVAVRAGGDLDLGTGTDTDTDTGTDTGARRVVSLAADAHLARSELLAELAARTGCRDADELWNHLFEVRQPHLDADTFAREVLAYCLLARLDTAPEVLEADGTLARERAMASAVRAAIRRREEQREEGDGPVVVVTGGFHTVHLPHLVAGDDELPARPSTATPGGAPCLIRYSFDRLDALHGYAAGMPSPRYHQAVWRAFEGTGDSVETDTEPFTAAAARLLVEIGRLSRERDLAEAVSPADEIAALEQCRRLAALRGHAGPTRADLLDAVRSVYLRSADALSVDDRGADPLGAGAASPLAEIVREVLGGRRIGRVPAAAGRPPIVVDFHRRVEALRLPLDSLEPRELALDLYRTRRHRQISRLLHAATFLEVPWARCVGGPDFVEGFDLERLQEHWQLAWSPQVEAALIDAAAYGDTVDEACLDRLRAAVVVLEDEGRGRDAAAPVRLLVMACRMGLQRHVGRLLEHIDDGLAEDPSFASVVGALGQLQLLWTSREPLEAHRLDALPDLVVTAYRRACYLLEELGDTDDPDERAGDEGTSSLDALVALRQMLDAVAGPRTGGGDEPRLDPDLLLEALERLLARPRGAGGRAAPAADEQVVGGAVGLLFGVGRIDEAALVRAVEGHLAGSGHTVAGVGMLQGLLTTCREVLWRVPALLERLDAALRGWSDDELLAALPPLRLGLSRLTPREVDRVAAAVARLYALDADEAFGDLVLRDVPEQEVMFNVRLGARLREALSRDGLARDGLALDSPSPRSAREPAR